MLTRLSINPEAEEADTLRQRKTKAGKAAVDPVAGAREINDPRIGS
jgi:hypothetical protein